jgi:hypothetical protein
MSWLEGLKDELGWSVEDAARQEINQGPRKGYKADREGKIKRGFFEQIGDTILGNDPELIRQRAEEIYTDNLKKSTKGKDVTDFRPSFELNSSTTKSELDDVHREVMRRQPLITQIKATGELGDKYTLDELRSMDVDSLTGVLKQARIKERDTDYATNPVTQQQIQQQNLTNQMALSQMALSEQRASNQMQIAMMDNQLERRRMDMKESRLDRKDRQAMIQQMMAGLSTLGASIAI